MNTKFTAGPWEVGYRALSVEAPLPKVQMKICDIRGWGCLTGGGAMNLPASEALAIQEANAHLIAAAPDLYEALAALVADECPPDSAWKAADAALRKARGESQ